LVHFPVQIYNNLNIVNLENKFKLVSILAPLTH
jgi:hypothetical protein